MSTTTTHAAIINHHQLSGCLDTARDLIVDCDRIIKASKIDEVIKAARTFRRALYSAFASADDEKTDVFALSKMVNGYVWHVRHLEELVKFEAPKH